ncbi:MAG: T9SS type A sorting domain-containing protein [Ignavibacteria bacterium]|nr:T9SS type A sorting domain-containing protein [Ignavibacteria bacterium]
MKTQNFKNRAAKVSKILTALFIFTAFIIMQVNKANSQPIYPYSDVKITAGTQGLYDATTALSKTNDTFTAELRTEKNPEDVFSWATSEIDKNTMEGYFRFRLPESSANGYTDCYIVLKHRNSLEIWSATPVRVFEDQANEINFTVAGNTYANNFFDAGKRTVMHSGDVNQDGFIDLEDYSLIENDVWNFTTGYAATDLNGDEFVDLEDLSIIESNIDKFLSVKSPLNPEGLKKNSEVSVSNKDIVLNQNYPNPFNPSTTISFSLSAESPVKLAVYDITGREVATLVNQNLQAGVHSLNWNAGNFTSGVYFLRINSSGFSETKQMNLIK